MNPISKEVFEIKKLVYDKCEIELSDFEIENQSTDYCASRFKINNSKIIFRVAKITPIKIGQFVTFWKRIEKQAIQPFDFLDDIDFFVVSTKTDSHFGQFVFPKAIFIEQGIVSSNHKNGKRAIRVYPPWEKTISKQAQKTQKWQFDYFLEIPFQVPINIDRAKKLYNQ